METKAFNLRLGNLEVRLRNQGQLEIAQWGESFSWVIAYWVEHKDGGFDLKFVGNRPFDGKVNPKDFWTIARAGQAFLDYGSERLE